VKRQGRQDFNPEAVRRRLRRCGVNQKQFAALAGIHEGSLCGYMTRKKAPNVQALRRIALALAALPELPGITELLGAR
jgi:hypothetical protein